MMTTETICLIDFCGYSEPGHFPTSYWADWNPATKLITFGGEWQEISPVMSETEPTDSEIDLLQEFAWWRVTDSESVLQ